MREDNAKAVDDLQTFDDKHWQPIIGSIDLFNLIPILCFIYHPNEGTSRCKVANKRNISKRVKKKGREIPKGEIYKGII